MADQKPEASTPETFEVSPEEASTNFYWTCGHDEVFALQTTIRGNPTGAEIEAHLRSALAAMKQVVAFGGHAKPGTKAANAINTEPAPVVPSVPAVPGVPLAPAPAPIASGPLTATCIMIEVGTSYSGNKPQLKFNCNGLQNPLTFTKDANEMAKLLAPLGFTPAHIVVGQKYPVSCVVTYTPNVKDGKTYNNVQSVRPA